jgi:hypothetical protein
LSLGGSINIGSWIYVGGKKAYGEGSDVDTEIVVDTPWSLKTATMTFRNGILVGFTKGSTEKNTLTISQNDADKRYLQLSQINGTPDSTKTIYAPITVGSS